MVEVEMRRLASNGNIQSIMPKMFNDKDTAISGLNWQNFSCDAEAVRSYMPHLTCIRLTFVTLANK